MIFFLIKFVFSALALWWVSKQVDINNIVTIFQEIPVHMHFWAFTTLCLSVTFNSARLYAITQKMGMKNSFRQMHEITWIGTFFNQLLPSGIGGDAYRIYSLSRENTVLISTSAVIWDRIIGLACMSLLCQPMLLSVSMPPALKTITVWAFSAIFLGMVSVFSFIRYPVFNNSKIIKSLWSTLAACKMLQSKPHTVFIGINCISAFFNFFSFYILVIALEIPLNFFQSSVLFTVSILITLIPLSISGWGLRESFFTTYLVACGLPPEKGLVLGVLQGIFILATGVVGAVVYLFSRNSQARQMRDAIS